MAENLGLTSENYTYDNLFAGDYPKVTESVTIESGQNLKRGALLGKKTGDDKYKLAISTNADGSEVPIAVLAADTDASAADCVAPIYEAGEFNVQEVEDNSTGSDLFPLSEANRQALRSLNIHMKTPVTE